MRFHSQFQTNTKLHLTPLKVETVVYLPLTKPPLLSLVTCKFVTGGMLYLQQLPYTADSSCAVDMGHGQTLTNDTYMTCRSECAIKETALCYTSLELDKN